MTYIKKSILFMFLCFFIFSTKINATGRVTSVSLDAKINTDSVFNIKWNFHIQNNNKYNFYNFDIKTRDFIINDSVIYNKYKTVKNIKSNYDYTIENYDDRYVIYFDIVDENGFTDLELSYDLHYNINEHPSFYKKPYDIVINPPNTYTFGKEIDEFNYNIEFDPKIDITNSNIKFDLSLDNNNNNFKIKDNKITGKALNITKIPDININNLNGQIKYTQVPFYEYIFMILVIIEIILFILLYSNHITNKTKVKFIYIYGFICYLIPFVSTYLLTRDCFYILISKSVLIIISNIILNICLHFKKNHTLENMKLPLFIIINIIYVAGLFTDTNFSLATKIGLIHNLNIMITTAFGMLTYKNYIENKK